MTLTRIAGAGAVVAVVGITLLALRRPADSPEDQVRKAVEDMAQAARTHDVAGVLGHVSERFQSPNLGTKNELRAYLLGELLRGGAVEARVLEARAEPRTGGEVLFSGRLFLGRTGGGLDLGQRAVEATFVSEDGAWRVIRARVEPVQ
jgi:hypothetical protein